MLKYCLKLILPLVSKFFSLFPLKYIVFESMPDYTDNTKTVYDEMIRRGINHRYKFVWICYDRNKKKSIPYARKSYNKIMQKYYGMRAKCLISCNTFMPSFGLYQKSIFLTHGFPVKSVGTYIAPPGIDYTLGLSDDTKEILAREIKVDVNSIIALGFPRNDLLAMKSRADINHLFGSNFKKIIVWYPTFRQSTNTKVPSATVNSLPIIQDEQTAIEINNFASKENLLIVLKPHFSQDLSYIKKLLLSNIVFITDDFYVEKNISSYEFVGACDALITDYSSIYFDYLLCDKPIGVIWEDIDEYKSNRGFAIDVDYYMKGASKIYSKGDFLDFLKLLSEDNDILKKERAEILKIAHKYRDFQSTKRVVDFIEEELLN